MAGVCLCVCVWGCVLCMLCAVLCYICSTNMRKSINMENKTGSNHGHNVVRKCKKTQETLGKYQKWSPFLGTIWPSMDRKKVRKRPCSPTHCFYVSPGICRRFRPKVLSQTPKNAVFDPRSQSKGPNHALKKVLTNETPGIWRVEQSAFH